MGEGCLGCTGWVVGGGGVPGDSGAAQPLSLIQEAPTECLHMRDVKDPLTLSASIEAWQRDRHPGKGVGAQWKPHISREIFVVVKKV